MLRRASYKLLSLRSVTRPNRIVTSPLTLRPSTTIVTRHFSGGDVSKKVEDVMPKAELQASGSFLQHVMRFSTSVPNDPDTHDDFKPTNKLENCEITLKDIVEQDVKDNHVMIYMKGDPEQPRCGFSSLAVRVLSEYRVPIHSRNILEDPELKNAVKAFSMWPTFPQIFINGEFIGGSDIILSMHQNGELKEKLKATSSD